MKRLIISAAVAACVSTSAMATTLTDAFSSFVVLGDSLSDNGNLFSAIGIPGAPYVDGRFSDGLVWNEGIAAEFTAAGQFSANFAFGGAETLNGALPPSVALQALNFGSIPPAALGATPLVSIWAGANDIRNTLSVGDFAGAPGAAVAAANNIAATVGALQTAGANDFLIFNLPDLGLTAELVGTPGSGLGTLVSTAFNTQLDMNIQALRGTGANIIEVDIFGFFAEVLADPAAFGFSNVTDACIFNPTTCDPSSWLFFDGIHPTSFAHGQIEDLARASIQATIPLPAGAPLYLLALAGFGLVTRRRS